jgi:hypothetical protein
MKKLLVIVPYRDRESHLKEFIPYITTTLDSQNINYKIVVVEQSPEKLFNRGLLCNIGFDLYKNQSDYICIHDIDMIGENFDYSYETIVTHLSARWSDRNYQEFYSKFLGGVVIFPKEDFIKINGFSNEYWGWGAEDDDLRLRCDIMNLKIQRKQGRFHSLPHERIEYKDRPFKSPGYINNATKLDGFRKQSYEDQIATLKNNGLSNIKNYYSLIQTEENTTYTLIKCQV